MGVSDRQKDFIRSLLAALENPTVEFLDRGATRSAISPRAGNPRFENSRCRDHLWRDAGERNFQTAAPAGIRLAGIGSDVDVDEALARGSLDKRTRKSRRSP